MLSIFSQRRSGDLTLGHRGKFPLRSLYRVPASARAKHLYVIGLTGKGKSKLLEHILYQDIAAGRGCGLIDPHSHLARDLLRLLITKGILADPTIRDRIIWVDPSRTDYIIPFNVLATGDDPYEIAASVMEAFRRTWPNSLREAPHFSNVVMAALPVLIENSLTLMDMPRLLTNSEFRERCLERVTNHDLVEFFHDRYDKWGRDAPVMRESTLNKIGAFQLNPRLKLMLGQKENRLDFRAIMDEGKILLVDLGNCDPETDRLIGSLMVTGLELAMRRRKSQELWNLTIDEFGGYVANEGSTKTLAHVFSEGRKFRMGMTVAHQNLSQLTPRMIAAISDVQTKAIFGIGRADAEHFAKVIGRVDTEAIKRDPKSQTQHELFSPMMEQWEKWIDGLRYQPSRQLTVSNQDGQVATLRTVTIPKYIATDTQVEQVQQECVARYGIPYSQAQQNIEQSQEEQTEQQFFDPDSLG